MKNNKKRNLLLSLILAAVCLVFTAYFIGFSSSESGILPYHFFWELY